MKSFAFTALVNVVIAAMVLASSSACAADLTPKDYVEIEQLYAKYNIAIDSGDAEGYANTFTPDGAFNAFIGRDALVAFAGTWREKMNGANLRHWNTNLRIVGTPEGANGSVYLMLLDVGTKPASISRTAMYSDSLVKTKDGWRFKRRATKADGPAAAPPQTTQSPAATPAKP